MRGSSTRSSSPGQGATAPRTDPAARLGLQKQQFEGSCGRTSRRSSSLQDRLWAEDTRSVLLVLQGLDTSGKDGTIGCSRESTPRPAGWRRSRRRARSLLEHDFLWRVHAACPGRGEIGIFNRSHYEDVGVVRVKQLVPKSVAASLPAHPRVRAPADRRGHGRRQGVPPHLEGRAAQAAPGRLDEPTKTWKFRLADLEDHAVRRLPRGLRGGSARRRPSGLLRHVVPADRKWVRDVVVATLLVETLRKLNPQYPPPPDDLGRDHGRVAHPPVPVSKSFAPAAAKRRRSASSVAPILVQY